MNATKTGTKETSTTIKTRLKEATKIAVDKRGMEGEAWQETIIALTHVLDWARKLHGKKFILDHWAGAFSKENRGFFKWEVLHCEKLKLGFGSCNPWMLPLINKSAISYAIDRADWKYLCEQIKNRARSIYKRTSNDLEASVSRNWVWSISHPDQATPKNEGTNRMGKFDMLVSDGKGEIIFSAVGFSESSPVRIKKLILEGLYTLTKQRRKEETK